MNKEEFTKLYDKFTGTEYSFSEDEWNKAIEDWKRYRELIEREDGLPIDRWLKNDDKGYLPDFLDTKEQKFGHARIGNYDQVMIYQFTGKKKKGKYIDIYKSIDKGVCKNVDGLNTFDSINEIEDDYNTKIRPLLKEIVSADTPAKVYSLERSKAFNDFTNKQILRKMIVLCWLERSMYDFLWAYFDDSLNTFAKIFGMDVDPQKTFFENNKNIYDQAKSFAGISATSSKEDYIKLYDFLWNLSLNIKEFTDFNNANIIFNGAPGTGKSYGVRKGIEYLQAIDGSTYKDVKYIQFHPSYTYQDFIEGIKPQKITAGSIDLKVVNGSFKKFCIFVKQQNEAYWNELINQNKKPDVDSPSDFKDWPHYYFVVDEINRGNLSNIFGETFSLLEYRDYDFSSEYKTITPSLISTSLSEVISNLPNDDKNNQNDGTSLVYKNVGENILFGIPFNIHFIGTMNDVDRSIDAFDLALRRRFKWITKRCNYGVIKSDLKRNGYPDSDIIEYVDSCKSLNKMICDPSSEGLKLGNLYEIGHSFFLKIKNIPGKKTITKTKKEEVFHNYISGTLKEYIRQVADEKDIDQWIEKAEQSFGIARYGE